MKIFLYVLGVIMLGLGCLPCSDGKAFNSNRETVNISTGAHQDQTQKHNDICNPFCSCACCGVTQVSHNIASFDLQLPDHSSAYLDTYSAFHIIAIALPIWQPPQLV
jgi:hypothetical protein